METKPMKKPGRFERSEDGLTWTEIDQKAMLPRLSNAYRNVEHVLAEMEDGHTVRTAFAFYRFNRDPQPA
jgi:hypothetical protein